MDLEAGRQKIRDNARELFTKISYAKTSVQDIASACGLGKGSIYHYFQSKDEILVAILEERHQRFIEMAERHFSDASIALERRAERYFDSLVDEYCAVKDLMFGDFDAIQGTVVREVVVKCDGFIHRSASEFERLLETAGAKPRAEARSIQSLAEAVSLLLELNLGKMIVFLMRHDWRDKAGLKAAVVPVSMKLFSAIIG
jgi:AcrR family transcriptional regulator